MDSIETAPLLVKRRRLTQLCFLKLMYYVYIEESFVMTTTYKFFKNVKRRCFWEDMDPILLNKNIFLHRSYQIYEYLLDSTLHFDFSSLL